MLKKYKQQVSVRIDSDIVERMKNIVYYTPGETVTSFVQSSIASQIGEIEREKGERFPKRRN